VLWTVAAFVVGFVILPCAVWKLMDALDDQGYLTNRNRK
jgi:hypothetical protein